MFWVEKLCVLLFFYNVLIYNMEETMHTKESIRLLLTRSDLACMRGVLARFRSQPEYEKGCRATVNKNGLGFRANHAKAGSALALWMSLGSHDGVFRRAVGGYTIYAGEKVARVDLCRRISMQYLEQLTWQANKEG